MNDWKHIKLRLIVCNYGAQRRHLQSIHFSLISYCRFQRVFSSVFFTVSATIIWLTFSPFLVFSRADKVQLIIRIFQFSFDYFLLLILFHTQTNSRQFNKKIDRFKWTINSILICGLIYHFFRFGCFFGQYFSCRFELQGRKMMEFRYELSIARFVVDAARFSSSQQSFVCSNWSKGCSLDWILINSGHKNFSSISV